MAHFDLIIVGTGVAGRTAAELSAAAGLSTALVDCREFGGTCALRGCEPKKVLASAAELPLRVAAQAGHGLAGGARLDWRELIAFKRTFTDSLPGAFEAEFARLGVTALHGVAQFTSTSAIEVAGERHTAEAFLLATGALPVTLGIDGEELLIDSERFMERGRLPKRVVFIGGGFISFELSGIAAAAGAKATIVHRSATPLKEFDPDLVALLVAQYAEQGIDVRLNSSAVCLRRSESTDAPAAGNARAAYVVELRDGRSIEADLVVHGAGRVPDLAALKLAGAGVAFGPHGVEVDSGMRSVSNPRVWAAGDAAALGPPLTPVGIAQARVAVRNIVASGSATFEPSVIPSAAFSQPPIASVGLSERQATVRGLDVAVKLTDTSGWVSSQRVGLKHAGAKTIVDRRTGRVLGAHIVGHNAEEVINIFALAIAQRATAEELKSLLWAYPTSSSEIVYLL